MALGDAEPVVEVTVEETVLESDVGLRIETFGVQSPSENDNDKNLLEGCDVSDISSDSGLGQENSKKASHLDEFSVKPRNVFGQAFQERRTQNNIDQIGGKNFLDEYPADLDKDFECVLPTFKSQPRQRHDTDFQLRDFKNHESNKPTAEQTASNPGNSRGSDNSRLSEKSIVSGVSINRKNIFAKKKNAEDKTRGNIFNLTGIEQASQADSDANRGNMFDISQEQIPGPIISFRSSTNDEQCEPRKSFLPQVRQSDIELQNDILEEISSSYQRENQTKKTST